MFSVVKWSLYVSFSVNIQPMSHQHILIGVSTPHGCNVRLAPIFSSFFAVEWKIPTVASWSEIAANLPFEDWVKTDAPIWRFKSLQFVIMGERYSLAYGFGLTLWILAFFHSCQTCLIMGGILRLSYGVLAGENNFEFYISSEPR